MLPPTLFSAYRQYKKDTDAVASWLMLTAKARGYPAHLLTNPASQQPKSTRLKGKARKEAAAQQKKDNQQQALPKYTVAIKDFVPLAQWIVSRQPPLQVPLAFSFVINRVIDARARFGVRAKDSLPDDVDSTERQRLFPWCSRDCARRPQPPDGGTSSPSSC